jgi:hypothetical protein
MCHDDLRKIEMKQVDVRKMKKKTKGKNANM